MISTALLKTLISPLLLLLLVALVRAILGLWRPRESRTRTADACLLILTIIVWLLSTPYVSGRLVRGIAVRSEPEVANSSPATVIVLAGGSFVGRDRRAHLTIATTSRVIRGVEMLRRSNARSIIMSGRATSGGPVSEAAAMRDLAIQLGVPPQNVQVEPDSRTTFDHPPEILRRGLARPAEHIAVVTDPTHLRRAVKEFHRIFPFVIPIATDTPFAARGRSIVSWIPQADSLDRSTRVITEWVGIGWYGLRHRFPSVGTRVARKAI